jgi:hypothetical protein
MGRNRCILYDNGERGVLLHCRLQGGTNRRLVFDAPTLLDALAAAGTRCHEPAAAGGAA